MTLLNLQIKQILFSELDLCWQAVVYLSQWALVVNESPCSTDYTEWSLSVAFNTGAPLTGDYKYSYQPAYGSLYEVLYVQPGHRHVRATRLKEPQHRCHIVCANVVCLFGQFVPFNWTLWLISRARSSVTSQAPVPLPNKSPIWAMHSLSVDKT